jgi:hypothetical protein
MAMRLDQLELHLYCQGLGDCHLIGVPREDGGTWWMLIDCGVHSATANGTARIRDVVADIARVTGGRLDLLVITHEHWDHLSGFSVAADLFAGITIGERWFAWTENPDDPLGRRLDRYKADGYAALADAALRLGTDNAHAAAAEALDAVIGFGFGAAGERVRAARNAARSGNNIRYLEPGTLAPLPSEASAIRCWVLGPPRSTAALGITDSTTQTYGLDAGGDGFALLNAVGNGMAVADGQLSVGDDALAPFDPGVGLVLTAALTSDAERVAEDPDIAFLSEHYGGPVVDLGPPGDTQPKPDQGWRRIDNDWLAPAASALALQLDSRTNNTSLVLAIEIAATGRVLLFTADAQIGSWQTWPGITFAGHPDVTGAKLIERTVFLKVGHHGSRNATLREGGLDAMNSPDLVAFIPTDETLAKKVRWNDIPASGLIEELRTRTHGRLFQSDAEWVQAAGHMPMPAIPIGGALRQFGLGPGPGLVMTVG